MVAQQSLDLDCGLLTDEAFFAGENGLVNRHLLRLAAGAKEKTGVGNR